MFSHQNSFIQNLSFRAASLNKLFGFKRFSRPFRVSFHLLLTLLLHYRSWGIFRFTSLYLVYSYEKTIPHYSGYLAATVQIIITRLSRSMAPHFRGIHLLWGGRTRSTHHISTWFPKGFGLIYSAFARRYSRNHCCFLFLLVLKCFTSQGSLSLMGILRIFEPQADVLLKHLGVSVYMRLTRAYRSLSRSSSVPKPRYPPNSVGVLAST